MAGAKGPTIEHCLDVLDDSGRAVESIPIGGRVVLGRPASGSAPDIPIPAGCRSVSRNHAVIEPGKGGLTLADQSRFGTLVNGQLVHEASVPLNDGDEIVFGLPADGWRVRYRVSHPGEDTSPADPLEMLIVTEAPRQVRIGRQVVEEHLGDRAFRLLRYLSENRGSWYPVPQLEDQLWPNPDHSPYQTQQALSRSKKAINDLLRPFLNGEDAVESAPYKGYRMKTRTKS